MNAARSFQGLALALAVLLGGIIFIRADPSSTSKVLYFLVLIPSVILHEVSHGVVALAFGDDTARRRGRLTLNPVSHVDPFGTIVLPVVMTLSGFGAIGYAKPVPVNVAALRHPRNESVLVSLAGPATNIVLAGLSVILFRATMAGTRGVIYPSVVFYLGVANVILAVFNLIPLPPLDGSAVVERLLPRSLWPGYMRVRAYAFPLLIFIALLLSYRFRGVFASLQTWWLHVDGVT